MGHAMIACGHLVEYNQISYYMTTINSSYNETVVGAVAW